MDLPCYHRGGFVYVVFPIIPEGTPLARSSKQQSPSTAVMPGPATLKRYVFLLPLLPFGAASLAR
jgi:hypothetical protein